MFYLSFSINVTFLSYRKFVMDLDSKYDEL